MPRGSAGRARFGETRDGVVIGERERADLARVRARSTSAAGASTPSEKWLCVWKSTRVSGLASIGGPYDTPRMSPTRIPGPIGRPSTPCCSISTARCSTRPTTTTSGATWCRSDSRRRSRLDLQRGLRGDRAAVRANAAARWTGIASTTGRARSASTSARCIARCARTWPGCRARASSCVRMRAGGKRLVLLTNSHPIALAVKHEAERRARLSRRGRHLT